MASVDLLVRIKAVGGNVLSRLSRGARDLNGDLQGASHSAGELDRNLKGAANATSNGTKAFSKMSQGLGGLVRVYAVIAANVFAASAAFEALRRAARVEQLTQSMEAFGMNTGVAMMSLSKEMRKASGSALDLEASMRAAAAGTTAGFSSTQILGITKVATNAAKVLGRDTGDSVDRLMRGLAKLEPELIDELGLMTRLSESTSNYARQQGKSTAQLTFFEKRMAFANAVLEEGTKKYDALGKAIQANKYDEIAASLSDLNRQVVGIISAPIGTFLSSAIDTISSAIASIKSLFASIGVSGETASKILLGSFAAVALFFTAKLVPSISNFKVNLANAAKEGAKEVDGIINDITQVQKGVQAKGLLSDTENPFGRLAKQSEDSIKSLDAKFNKTYANIEANAGITAQSVKRVWTTAVNGGLQASKASMDSLDALRASASNTINQINTLSMKMPRQGVDTATRDALDAKLKTKLSRAGITDFQSLERYATQTSRGRKSEDIMKYYEALSKAIKKEQEGLLILEHTEQQLKDIVKLQTDRQVAASGAAADVAGQPVDLRGLVTGAEASRIKQISGETASSEYLKGIDSATGPIDHIRKAIGGIKPAIDLYKNNLRLAGIETESFAAKAEAAFLGVKLAALGLASTVTKIVTGFIKIVTVAGSLWVTFDILKGVIKGVRDYFLDDTTKKYTTQVEDLTKQFKDFSDALVEVSKNAKGFNNLMEQVDFTGAVNQRYNSLTEISNRSKKVFEDQNKAVAEGTYLLQKQVIELNRLQDIVQDTSGGEGTLLARAGASGQAAKQKLNIDTTTKARTEAQNKLLAAFAESLNTAVTTTLGSSNDKDRLIEFNLEATKLADTLKNQLPAGVVLTQDEFGRLSIVQDEAYEGTLILTEATDALANALRNALDVKTITIFQNFYQTLKEVNTAATTVIQNIQKSVLPSNDFLVLRDSLFSLKSAYSEVSVAVEEYKAAVERAAVATSDIPTVDSLSLNTPDIAAAGLAAEKALKSYADISAAARETNKVISEDIITVGINSLAKGVNPGKEAGEQAVAVKTIQRFKEIEKVRKSLEKTIAEGDSKAKASAQVKLAGLNADKNVQDDTIKYTNTMYGPGGLIESAIETSNKLALETQALAAAQEELNGAYERFSLLSKLSVAGSVIDLDKQRESLQIAKDNLDLDQRKLELNKSTGLAETFVPSIFDSDKVTAQKRANFDEAKGYATAQYDAGLKVITAGKVYIALQEETNKIDRQRTLDIIEQDNGIKRITNQQTKLNIEAEKYRGIINDTVTGSTIQLGFTAQQLDLDNQRLVIETKKASINLQAAKDATKIARVAGETPEQATDRIAAASGLVEIAQAEYNLTVSTAAATQDYNRQKITSANIESKQIKGTFDLIDNLDKSKDINSEIFTYISGQTDLYGKTLDLLKQRVDLELELKSIEADRTKDQAENLKFEIDKRKAIRGDTPNTTASLKELQQLNSLELTNQRQVADQRLQAIKNDISFLNSESKSFTKQAALPSNTADQSINFLNAAAEKDRAAADLGRKLTLEEERAVIEERRTLQAQELIIIEAAKAQLEYQNKFVASFGTLNAASEQIWYQIGVDFESSIENSMGFVQGAANIFTGAVDTAAESFVDAVIEGKDILDSMKEGLRSSLIESIGGLAKDQLKQGLMLGIGQLPVFQRDEQGNLKNNALNKMIDPSGVKAREDAAAIATATAPNFSTVTDNATTNANNIIAAIRQSSIPGTAIPQVPSPMDMTEFKPLPSVKEMIQPYVSSPPSNVVGNTDYFAESLKYAAGSTEYTELNYGASTRIDANTGAGVDATTSGFGKSNWLTANLTDTTIAGFASIATAIAAGGSTKSSIIGGVLGIAGTIAGSMIPGLGRYGAMIGGQIGAMAGTSIVDHAKGGVMTSEGPMPLQMYAKGGIANSPQLAMFGEGRKPEAYVPLPDGRSIPVTMDAGAGNVNNIAVNVAVDNKGNSQTSTGGTNSEEYTQKLGVAISNAVKSEIASQQRPGGLLYRGRR